jgi:hypothetical protein
MINKEDFIFTIGYQGDTAIVDGSAKKQYHNCNAEQLAENGLFKSAVCFAVYDDDQEELEHILNIYNSKTGFNLSSPAELKKVFGVTDIPEGIEKVKII